MGTKTRVLGIIITVVLVAFLAVVLTPIILWWRSLIWLEDAQRMITTGVTLLGPLLAALVGYYFSVASTRSRQALDEKVQEIEARVERHPEQPRFAWDLARTKLEAYFDRNLAQVNLIFWVSIAVMMVGFGVTVQALIFRWTKAANHGKLILGAAGQ